MLNIDYVYNIIAALENLFTSVSLHLGPKSSKGQSQQVYLLGYTFTRHDNPGSWTKPDNLVYSEALEGFPRQGNFLVLGLNSTLFQQGVLQKGHTLVSVISQIYRELF